MATDHRTMSTSQSSRCFSCAERTQRATLAQRCVGTYTVGTWEAAWRLSLIKTNRSQLSSKKPCCSRRSTTASVSRTSARATPAARPVGSSSLMVRCPSERGEQSWLIAWGFRHVRLSCQLQASQPMRLRRVIKDQIDHQLLKQSNDAQERPLAVLFSDIRSFTSFSERHLPYDIVHILNRYFLSMGEAIHAHHGQIDKYMGDGIMALFASKAMSTLPCSPTARRSPCKLALTTSTTTSRAPSTSASRSASGSITAT